MEKVIISAEEFLSLYTGVLIKDIDTVYEGSEKVFGFNPHTLTLVQCIEQFADHIDATRPDLVQAVKNTGIPFNGSLSKEQVAELCENFKAEAGETVEVDKITFISNEDANAEDNDSAEQEI